MADVAPPTTGLKGWLSNFPTQPATTATALLLLLLFGLVATVRLAMGKVFPDGYEGWMVALLGLAGVSTAGMVGKRVSDFRYKAAGTSPVSVDTALNVNTSDTADGAAAPAGATVQAIRPAASVPVAALPVDASTPASDAPGQRIPGEGD